MVGMTWKSTSSCGWEYFGYVRGLGFESYVCYFCVIVLLFQSMQTCSVWYDAWIMIVSMKHDWLNWLCTWVVTKGSWVQTLEILNGTYAYFYFC